jgi:hypothetical protein
MAQLHDCGRHRKSASHLELLVIGLENVIRLPGIHGFPSLDFQRWGTSEARMKENKNPLVEVYRLPHLKFEMWATQL